MKSFQSHVIKWQHAASTIMPKGKGDTEKRRAEDCGPSSGWIAVSLASQFIATQLLGNYLKTLLKGK